MITQEEALRKLEKYVEVMSREFHEKADGMFISEYTLQSRLAGFMWNDGALWFQDISLKQGESLAADFPAVYREWYMKSGKIDIAILGRNSVSQWVSAIRHHKPYARLASELSVFAGLQIKSNYGSSNFNEDIRKDLDNLLAVQNIKYRFQLIFYSEASTSNRSVIDGIVRDYTSKLTGHDFYVCFCSCDSPVSQSKWVPEWVIPSLPQRL